jgi:selenocysteine lyase/cysteine desulfurase
MNRERNQDIAHFPQDVEGLPRRRFMQQLLGTAAAAAVLPSRMWGNPADSLVHLEKGARLMPAEDSGDEAFWRLVKEQFMLRERLIMLNAANLCPSPYPVQQTVFSLTRDIDRDPSSINRRKFSDLREKSREALAAYLGADTDEIAITRNTSEGNNIVIGGLTFKPGDEVVIWDENHPTANIAWDVRAERYGFEVKRVKIPSAFESGEELIRPFREALSGRTRILCFSHLSNLSGVALPAKAICRMARERGILTHIDGAQTFGSQKVDLHDLGCDYYTGSAHKWFVGPREVGVLYVRRERIPGLWPSIVGVGYSKDMEEIARKLETLGQRDDARIAAMATTVEFHSALGVTRIERRIKRLAAALKSSLLKHVPRVRFITPLRPENSGGVVVFSAPGIDLKNALNALYHEHDIGAAVFGGELSGIRLCPHIYNTLAEMEQAALAVSSLIGDGP